MAIVTRYFSTTGAGAADGTTWADRAPLLNAGVYSTIITGFAFNGTDSLFALVEELKTYTVTTGLVVGAFANPPTVANSLTFHGCDSSGNVLVPSFWTCDTPATWDSALPNIATTTNIIACNVANTHHRLLKYTATARTGSVLSQNLSLDWISIENSQSATAAAGLDTNTLRATNISIKMTGTGYTYGMAISNTGYMDNIRVEGNLSATTGNRHGFLSGGTTVARPVSRLCSFNHPGNCYLDNSGNVNSQSWLINSVLANGGSTGLLGSSFAGQGQINLIRGCMITGHGGFGVDGSVGIFSPSQNRLRDNTSGNFTNIGNYQTTLLNEVSAGSDAAEYVDATNGDFRIKYGSAIWGLGYGVSDQPNPGSSGFSYTFG